MSYVLLAMLLVAVYKIKITPVSFSADYISKHQTTAINGLFILIVFCSHYQSYAEVKGNIYLMRFFFGQLMVTTFLFYSGYGCAESYLNNGSNYISNFFRNRFLSTLVNFDIAVLIYALLGLLLHKGYSIERVLLSLTGWEQIGNSSWYIFIILCLYLLFFLSYFFTNKYKRYIAPFVLTVLSIIFIEVMYCLHPGSNWWYDTCLCFTAGVWYAYWKSGISRWLTKSNIRYYINLISMLAVLIFCHKSYGQHSILFMNAYAIIFALLFAIGSMKIQVRSPILQWCGNHLFELYIFQSISLILFKHLGLGKINNYLYFIASLATTILIAWKMRKVYGILDGYIKVKQMLSTN